MQLKNVTDAQARALRALDLGPLVRKKRNLWGWDVPESRAFTTTETLQALWEKGLVYPNPMNNPRVTITDTGHDLVNALNQERRR